MRSAAQDLERPNRIACLVSFGAAAAILAVLIIFEIFSNGADAEISEEAQLELFVICETHPHLRAAYHRANNDGVITNGEHDEILDQIRIAMRRGIPST